MTRRRKRFLIVTAGIVLGLIAVQSTMFVRPRCQITIEVDGTSGQSIVATFDVDGKRYTESKELPTDFAFQARHVSFVVIPKENRGKSYLAVKAYRDDEHLLSCRDTNGVKGNVIVPSLLGLGSNNTGIGGMRPEELARLR